jgi:hypothetical protein
MRTPIATRTSAISLVAFCAALITSLAYAATSRLDNSNPIIVTDVAGTVSVTTAGVDSDVRVDETLGLPSRIVTGHDGTLGIKQAHTSISIAPDSEIAIPAEAADGNLIARLVQYRGNVFYDVAPREASKLHVETPFLVAVIKGTQFNVAVGEDSTTISLFEGRLEIRTPDESEVIELAAGEIAIRGRADSTIRVVGMDEDRLPTPRADAAVAADGAVAANRDATVSSLGSSVLAANVRGERQLSTLGNTADDGLPIAEKQASTLLAADLDLNKSSAGVDTGIAVNNGAVSAEVGSNISLGGATVNVGLSSGLDLSANATVGTSVDLGAASVDLAADAGADLGAANVDVGLGAGLDLGGASVDLGIDAGTALGGTSVDLGVALDADVSGGADLGLDLDDQGIGVDVGADLSTGDVDVGVDLSVGELDLGIDLDGDEPVIDILPPPPPPGDDKGLGGLLGRIL